MNWLLSLICCFSFKVCLAAQAALPQAEFFSEGAYSSGTSIFSNSLFARAFAPLGTQIRPFLQMGSEQFFGEEGSSDLYISPGLSWNGNLLRVFGEHRFHQRSREVFSTSEWRLLLAGGKSIDFAVSSGMRLCAFWEPYTEILLSSQEGSNLWFQGFSRVGFKYRANDRTFTDIFLEPYFSFVQNRATGEEKIQLRPSLRATTCFEKMCASVSAARVVSVSKDVESGFRFLATLGGLM